MGDRRTNSISSLLGVNLVIPEGEGNGVVLPAPQTIYSVYDYQSICSVLCAYRFFDIVSLRASVPPVSASPPVPMFLPGSSHLKEKDDLHVRL